MRRTCLFPIMGIVLMGLGRPGAAAESPASDAYELRMQGKVDQVIDPFGYFLFVPVGIFKGFQGRCPLRGGGVRRLKDHPPAALIDKVKELHGMKKLFLSLYTHPVRKAVEVY